MSCADQIHGARTCGLAIIRRHSFCGAQSIILICQRSFIVHNFKSATVLVQFCKVHLCTCDIPGYTAVRIRSGRSANTLKNCSVFINRIIYLCGQRGLRAAFRRFSQSMPYEKSLFLCHRRANPRRNLPFRASSSGGTVTPSRYRRETCL